MRRAYSSGVASHGWTAACAATPSRSASARVGQHADERVGESVRVARLHENAGDAVLDDVGDAADTAADDSAAAAERLDDDAAQALGARRKHEDGRLVECPRNLGRRERLRPASLCGQIAHERRGRLVQGSAPDQVQRRVGHTRRSEPPRLREHVHGLVALEHADEEHDRPLGQRNGRRLDERLEIHERRELGGRLDACLADETRRIRRDRANAVAVPQPVAREGVRERREQLPPRRSVEPRRRGRVTVDVRDHTRRHPREPSSDDCERRLLRALGEHGIGPKCAQLTRDPKRQQ